MYVRSKSLLEKFADKVTANITFYVYKTNDSVNAKVAAYHHSLRRLVRRLRFRLMSVLREIFLE